MTPYARQIIREVATLRHVLPQQIAGHCRIRKVFRARVEVAKLLSERGYSTNRIGQMLHKDHTTIVYYLGRGGRRPVPPVQKWRKPKIRHLNHSHCKLCYFGPLPLPKPSKPPKPDKRYLIPYIGADCDYVWRESIS